MSKRTYRSKEDWKRLIAAQHESGLSAAEFCRRQGISAKYFSRRKAAYLRHTNEPKAPPSAFVAIQPPTGFEDTQNHNRTTTPFTALY